MSGCIDIIEYLRDKMIQMAETRDLVNPDVVHISQRLDLFIVQSQKRRMAGGDNGTQGQAVPMTWSQAWSWQEDRIRG